MKKILVVDDERNIQNILKEVLTDEGYSVTTTGTGKGCIGAVSKEFYDAIILDVKLPDIDGISIIKNIKEVSGESEIVVISGHATIEMAVEAIKRGAYDFIKKPLSLEKVRIVLRHALEMHSFRKEKQNWDKEIEERYRMVGDSNGVREVKVLIEKVAPLDSKVLIMGESGVGKELVAYAIHKKSNRKNAPFIKVNCAAIPTELVESELFGYEKGAFTGAVGKKIGKFESADKGSILLDEIGDMDLATQSKVLRLIETGEVIPLGSAKSLSIDVRIIASTNRNIEDEVKKGNFREDLFFRLNVFPLKVPPLRERKNDVPLLVNYFVNDVVSKSAIGHKEFSKEAVNVLMNYDFPGNVRELRNIVERLLILKEGEEIKEGDVKSLLTDIGSGKETSLLHQPYRDAKRNFEKLYIEEKLKENDWNVSKTAKELGIERPNLYRKMRELKIGQKE
ncbi:sigma-54-dependent Fis family transcriptional regulator [candidate division WOR-3 bacterium]|nr:sigma-54-dependent Fis family transcriptional regulator [candidate division WOR-3 bacterium]MCK4575493.1 sigma-54-dependent Fis family transcriptional regulator [candidate division WOR-3 bacterium]